MKEKLLGTILPLMLSALPADFIKTLLDTLLDTIEDTVAKSESDIDDAIVLPMCKLIRESLNIPDND